MIKRGQMTTGKTLKSDTCGNCVFFLEPDEKGKGYCATKDLFTDVHKDDKVCSDFIKNKDK